MKPDIALLPKVEEALGFKLTDAQKRYIFLGQCELSFLRDRCKGFTTAFILRLLLTRDNMPLVMYPYILRQQGDGGVRNYTDMLVMHNYRYSYLPRFRQIADALNNRGVPITDIIWTADVSSGRGVRYGR